MTRQIPLTKGQVALVDDADFQWLSQWKWHVGRAGKHGFYAVRKDGKGSTWMHRVIMDAPSGTEVDHADRNPLNNTRANLRVCSRQENMRNRVMPTSSGGYRGVYVKRDKFVSRLGAAVLGSFDCPIAAAAAYDRAAIEAHGEFAVLNFSTDRDWILPVASRNRRGAGLHAIEGLKAKADELKGRG